MTASQRPDAGHAPLTSPAAAGSGPTGHDKAVELVEKAIVSALNCSLEDYREEATAVLARLRAALAAGDPDVAQALDVPSLLAAAEAKALRDAAAAYLTEKDNTRWILQPAKWLRERAGRIEAP